MSRIEHTFNTQDELVEVLSNSIALHLQNAIKANGKASLVVSGGNTPKPLFIRLSEMPLEWDKVNVGLCDERWVPPGHKDSNENLVRTYLLQKKAKSAKFIGMYIDGVEIEEAEKTCERRIKRDLLPIDVIVLGMGNDAHTASLFPENYKLDKAFDLENESLCISIEPTTAPYRRMSLTRRAILDAVHIYLHFEGVEKLEVYQEAIGGEDMYKMPIRSVLNQELKDVEVYYV